MRLSRACDSAGRRRQIVWRTFRTAIAANCDAVRCWTVRQVRPTVIASFSSHHAVYLDALATLVHRHNGFEGSHHLSRLCLPAVMRGRGQGSRRQRGAESRLVLEASCRGGEGRGGGGRHA